VSQNAVRSLSNEVKRAGFAAQILGMLALGASTVASSAHAQTLRGSKGSVEKMYWFAVNHRMSFRHTPEAISADAARGRLVQLGGSLDYALAGGVGWPFVTPETKRFVELFAEQYSAVCEGPLMLTSASRPLNRQPRNANKHSVHPAGIAIDLRRPPRGPCLDWTRQALVELERRGIVEATEERRPVHFHVAVLTTPGRPTQLPMLRVARQDPVAKRAAWLAVRESHSVGGNTNDGVVGLTVMHQLAHRSRSTQSPWSRALAPFDRFVRGFTTSPLRAAGANALGLFASAPAIRTRGVVVTEVAGDVALDSAKAMDTTSPTTAAAHVASAKQARTHRVRPGDTLWDIARKYHTRVEALLVENRLPKNAALRPGAVLKLPEECCGP
jgi:hypothetical protein